MIWVILLSILVAVFVSYEVYGLVKTLKKRKKRKMSESSAEAVDDNK